MNIDKAQYIVAYDFKNHRKTYTSPQVMHAFAYLAWEFVFSKYEKFPINLIGAKGSGTTLSAALCMLYPKKFCMYIASHYKTEQDTWPEQFVMIDDCIFSGRTLEELENMLQKHDRIITEAVVIKSELTTWHSGIKIHSVGTLYENYIINRNG